eukprot:s1675_g6.t1
MAQDENETWCLTYLKKKALYGPNNRVRIGSEKPHGETEPKGTKRMDADVEPVAYHALPSEATELMKRLEAKCWDGMLKPDSPLYEPLLASLFKTGQKGNRKAPPARAKAKGKAKSKKNAKNDAKDDDEQEDEEDEEKDDEEDIEEEVEEEDEEEEDDAGSNDEEDGDEEEDDEQEGKKGKKRKSESSAGSKVSRGKRKGKGKRSKGSAKSKAKAKGRPKAGNKNAKSVLDKLNGLMMVGLKAVLYYMSESDKPLRKRLKSLYKPEILSSNCHKFKGGLAAIIFLGLLILPVMDSFGYAGLPQRRERLWIVGTNKYATRRKFKFPSPLPWAGKGNPSYEVSPCLTRARGGGDSFWITSPGRYMNLQEPNRPSY